MFGGLTSFVLMENLSEYIGILKLCLDTILCFNYANPSLETSNNGWYDGIYGDGGLSGSSCQKKCNASPLLVLTIYLV